MKSCYIEENFQEIEDHKEEEPITTKEKNTKTKTKVSDNQINSNNKNQPIKETTTV